MAHPPLTPIQRNVAYLAIGGGLLALVVTAVWFNSLGFSWTVPLIFHWHPVLMVAAWLVAAVNAALAYRVFPFTHDTSKAVHGALHVLTLVLWSTALAAVVKSHNDRSPPLQNFYSLHSWFGLATIIGWSCNVSAQRLTVPPSPPSLLRRSLTAWLSCCVAAAVHCRLHHVRLAWSRACHACEGAAAPRVAGHCGGDGAVLHQRAAGHHGVHDLLQPQQDGLAA